MRFKGRGEKRLWRTGTLAAAVAGVCLSLAGGPVVAQGEERVPGLTPSTEDETAYRPPEPRRVFRMESEAQLMERMRREARQGPDPQEITFPDTPPTGEGKPLSPRDWDALVETIEPVYVCYGRLYFEQINAERYGWDLGLLHPVLSAGIFYADVLTLPYHLGTEPLRACECDAGYCLPGDPVPLLLYPPEISATGALTEAAVIGLMFVVFP